MLANFPRSLSRRLVVSLATLAGSVAPVTGVHAQVVTPPPKEVTPIDWNIPKPPPAPTAAPMEVNANPVPAPRPAQAPVERLPDLKYTPLAEKGADGKLVSLKEPLHLSAMRRNPMLPEGYIDSIQNVIDERKQSTDRQVVANLDVLERIEDGAFENVDFMNRASVRSLMETIKPLTSAMKTLGEDLRERGLMDPMQTRFNNKIVNDYVRAANEEKMAASEADKGKSSQALLLSLYKQNVDEFVFVHAQAMKTIVSQFDEAIGPVLADEATKSKTRDVVAKARSAGTDGERTAALKGLRDVLSLDQRKQLVEKAISLSNDSKARR